MLAFLMNMGCSVDSKSGVTVENACMLEIRLESSALPLVHRQCSSGYDRVSNTLLDEQIEIISGYMLSWP